MLHSKRTVLRGLGGEEGATVPSRRSGRVDWKCRPENEEPTIEATLYQSHWQNIEACLNEIRTIIHAIDNKCYGEVGNKLATIYGLLVADKLMMTRGSYGESHSALVEFGPLGWWISSNQQLTSQLSLGRASLLRALRAGINSSRARQQ